MTATEKNSIAEHVSTFVGCLYEEEDIIEIRLHHSVEEKAQSRFTTPPQLESHIKRLMADNNAGWNIYLGINPRKHVGDGSSAKHCDGTKCGKCARCVKLSRCIFADFDGTTLDEARAKLATTSLPAPSLTVNSGHGIHCYWRLTSALYELDTWTRFQIDLAALLGSDPVIKDAPRIMRLPGFKNTKAEPHVWSAVVEVPE